jgi:hypothetical protein
MAATQSGEPRLDHRPQWVGHDDPVVHGEVRRLEVERPMYVDTDEAGTTRARHGHVDGVAAVEQVPDPRSRPV